MTTESRGTGPEPQPLFSWPTRVYWEDTDAGGVVYHARYVAFLERARTEWLRALGYGQERLRLEHDLVFAVHAMQLDFLRPARLDDFLQVGVALSQCKRASLLFAQSIHRDGELLLRAQVKVAALGAGSFRPRAIDDVLYAALNAIQITQAESLRNDG
ncbi:tol-pal system-associated acyl-CoA thioesterase [Xanthomonas albilineans]|uniref:tol-pal system-associated acyl-CoA thioesterase n=1 Tax=Xanthomonas albilineans TaxID=29447 RepID=UPI0005F302C6|nr:tol-pal system-associated acyl-CoA thioesterase [Xanthomonas albilineans]